MKLNDRDMNLVLSGLKLISDDNSFTSDIKRRAKELEDRIGLHYAKGCEISEIKIMANDDGLWLFKQEIRRDVEVGIEKAREVKDAPVGHYANKLNLSIDKIEKYLIPHYRTPTGRALGLSGRSSIIGALCLDDDAQILQLLK